MYACVCACVCDIQWYMLVKEAVDILTALHTVFCYGQNLSDCFTSLRHSCIVWMYNPAAWTRKSGGGVPSPECAEWKLDICRRKGRNQEKHASKSGFSPWLLFFGGCSANRTQRVTCKFNYHFIHTHTTHTHTHTCHTWSIVKGLLNELHYTVTDYYW